jgi:hypothetical protein
MSWPRSPTAITADILGKPVSRDAIAALRGTAASNEHPVWVSAVSAQCVLPDGRLASGADDHTIRP